MRIALASKKFENNNMEKNLQTMLQAMKEAREMGAELICFGEAFLQGFDTLRWNYDCDKGLAVNIYSEAINKICSQSRKCCIDVLFGYFEREKDKILSSAMIVERGEVAYNYQRITRGWKEYSKTDAHYIEGHVVEVFEYRHKRCMIALCGDLWECEQLFNRNEEILFWPCFVGFSKKDWEENHKKAYEEKASRINSHVLMINSLSDDGGLGGCFYYNEGKTIKEIPLGQEGIIMVEID